MPPLLRKPWLLIASFNALNSRRAAERDRRLHAQRELGPECRARQQLAVGIAERAAGERRLQLDRLAAVQADAVEIALADAPLVKELQPPVVLHDAPGRYAGEVVDERVAQADEGAAAGLPELHRKIGVAAHAGRELGAVAADFGPQVARQQRRRPGRSEPMATLEARDRLD